MVEERLVKTKPSQARVKQAGIPSLWVFMEANQVMIVTVELYQLILIKIIKLTLAVFLRFDDLVDS